MGDENQSGVGTTKEKKPRTRKAPEYVVQMRAWFPEPADGSTRIPEQFRDTPDPEMALNSPESAAEYAQSLSAARGEAIEFRTVRVVDGGIVKPVTTATIERPKGARRSR